MQHQETHKYTDAISYQVEGSTRIAPYNVAKYFQSADIRSTAAELAGIDEASLFGSQVPGMVQIKANHAMVECVLPCGLPLVVRVPLRYFEGVGARFVVGKREGSPLICLLELVHKDPQLTIPLMASTDLEDAAVDWACWSRLCHLSMLHQPLGSGGYVPVDPAGRSLSGLAIAPEKQRRHHAQFAARRPRFLTRRKVGSSGQANKVAGREIIART
ncbi:DUF6101 family protein [Cohaesibacter celericrescens]|uniref:Uncharacterized protein n=1 Tax=Cohaesibacter celericrescens TaxID=2067669 RepID=A0A2N5XKJ5_9HYPH|nr:DUF6101 family protein [Cohaesibacter celericrescens]PLW75041.1 hypothetical protein C0081_22345 [Cohaesibacter celericrescens]